MPYNTNWYLWSSKINKKEYSDVKDGEYIFKLETKKMDGNVTTYKTEVNIASEVDLNNYLQNF